jgi:hypothetical protein
MILTVETDDELLSRNVISAASTDGLVVIVNGAEQIRPWDTVTAASATTVERGDARIFVLAIVFDDVRTFVLAEIEAGWSQVVEYFHLCLPGVEPFSTWAPRLLAEQSVLDLFDREA